MRDSEFGIYIVILVIVFVAATSYHDERKARAAKVDQILTTVSNLSLTVSNALAGITNRPATNQAATKLPIDTDRELEHIFNTISNISRKITNLYPMTPTPVKAEAGL